MAASELSSLISCSAAAPAVMTAASVASHFKAAASISYSTGQADARGGREGGREGEFNQTDV